MSGRTLTSDLRNQLARVIQGARRTAEAGARNGVEALAVGRHEPHGSMSPEERGLRNRLRAHGRQLGDERDRDKGTQQIQRLVHEVAYEHWHRMLFARFLAENQLLIEPESGVAISMAECEELARERGEDPWAFAGRAASRMLPRIFRPDDPALEVMLAPETCQALERLLESLPPDVFSADDSLGWTYQFWQAERKDEVNASGGKIGADELPAVTQLFTEHYMVQFLFHNSVGAWRAGKILSEHPELAENAADEDELRQAARLEAQSGYDFDYLRFVREPRDGDEEGKPTGPWRPAAGRFEDWPRNAAELRVLDPCCGSGHFLVEGFELVVRLRMEEEGLPAEEAIRAVLADSLFGLELDVRCTQIAAFNLALAAWKLAGRLIELPPLQIACSGIAIGASKKEWLQLAGSDSTLRAGMEWLYELFEKAPELGSLIDPRAGARDMRQMDYDVMQPLLAAALEREAEDAEKLERAVAAQGMARAADLLAQDYTLVVTNPPYLARGKQSESLKQFSSRYHSAGESDLATVFLRRFAELTREGGAHASVTPMNWLLIRSYRDLRRDLVVLSKPRLVARVGSAIEAKASWDVLRALAIISTGPSNLDDIASGVEAPSSDEESRAVELISASLDQVSMQLLARVPDFRFVFDYEVDIARLADLASSFQGIATADYSRFGRCYWEIPIPDRSWDYQQSTVGTSDLYAGREQILLWEQGAGVLARSSNARVQGLGALGNQGVAITQTRKLQTTLFTGHLFDNNVAALVVHDPGDLPGAWCFCSSVEFADAVRRFDEKLGVTNATFLEVNYDRKRWQKVATEKYPHGLPEPQSNDPTQWLFHGHPAGMVAAGSAECSPWGIADLVRAGRDRSLICREANLRDVLQVSLASLIGYCWPPENDPEMHLDPAARAWAERCRELDKLADEDGIVCLYPTRGEAAAADRVRQLLVTAFGNDWSAARERELLTEAAQGGTPAPSLEEWLRDRFFEEHCKLFHHRPFVWHIWDGRKDGFHALVNYHRLAGPDGEGRRTLEALTYSYLGDWTLRQKAEQRDGVEGADARLAAAQDLQAQLEKILAGEPPCDLFVRWKPLHRQPIGWEPDINDGVRLNIRPFMAVKLRKGGRKGAGILRWKPNIKWKKDRGKEPQSIRPREDFPWFWSCPGDGTDADRTDFSGGPDFDGNRWNDLHYTNATKRAARDGASQEDER